MPKIKPLEKLVSKARELRNSHQERHRPTGFGFALADWVPEQGLYAEAFAGGAVVTMLANSMMPEAFENGGSTVGLLTVLGYLVAAALTVAQ